MKKYNFYIDRKWTIWDRCYYSVEASSEEEALKLCKENYDEDNSEYLYETVDSLTPEENSGNATKEIYNADTNKLLFDNAIKE